MLNKRELDILKILLEAETPLIAIDIVYKSGNLTQSTVTCILRKFLNQGLVEVVGFGRSGKVLSRQYSATEKAKEAVINHFVEFYCRINGVISIVELFKHLDDQKLLVTGN